MRRGGAARYDRQGRLRPSAVRRGAAVIGTVRRGTGLGRVDPVAVSHAVAPDVMEPRARAEALVGTPLPVRQPHGSR